MKVKKKIFFSSVQTEVVPLDIEECQSVEKQLDDGDETNQQLEKSEIEVRLP